jgi:hypothetical protein
MISCALTQCGAQSLTGMSAIPAGTYHLLLEEWLSPCLCHQHKSALSHSGQLHLPHHSPSWRAVVHLEVSTNGQMQDLFKQLSQSS